MPNIKILTILFSIGLMVLSGCGVTKGMNVSAQAAISQPAKGKQVENESNTNTNQNLDSGILMIGQTAPNVSLATEKNLRPINLSQYFGKKPMIINAWASWCPPCNAETPDLVKLYKKYGSQVQFIGVNLTTLDSVQKAQSFVQKYAIPYPVLMDIHGDFYRNYTVIAEPMTYVLNQSGKVLAIHIGAMQLPEMEQLVQQALASRQA